MNNVVGIGGVVGVVIISVISAFFVGGIIMGLFASSPDQINKVYLYISFFLGQGIIIMPPIYYLNIKKKPILNALRIKSISINTLKYSIIFSLGVLIIFDTLDRIIHRLVTTPDYIIDLGQIMQPDSTAVIFSYFLPS